MMMRWIFALAAALAMGGPVLAQERASIDDAQWLIGRWVGEGLGGEMEEAWSPPMGGQMIGYFRLAREGEPVFYEIMLLEETEEGLAMRVKHFNPDFVGWEEKDAWVRFAPVSSSDTELRFTALTLTRDGDDEMTGTIRIRYSEDDVREEVLRYRRAPQ